MTIIRHEDLRVIEFCNKGARQFCVRHGIDWSAFMRDGVDAKTVSHVDDEMLKQVIRAAEKRERGQV